VAKASSSPPPTTTTPPYTTLPPPLLDSPISTPSHPFASSAALDYPYSIATCARPQDAHLQHQPTTRRTRSLYIIRHGSAIENACCRPRNGWRRRCSSAGKSCFLILSRNTMVLACSSMRTRPNQPTIKMSKELFVCILFSEHGDQRQRLDGDFLSRDEHADKLCLPWICFAPAILHARGHRNGGSARLRYSHRHSRRIETTYTTHHTFKHAEKTRETEPIPG
jgi:hypothetical protein